ncbi:MAG: hypothetical protein EXR51_05645 [Dehalococcoidia bacterium]|nr:hypothetical protein [Dehalococcoidia bacterium]
MKKAMHRFFSRTLLALLAAGVVAVTGTTVTACQAKQPAIATPPPGPTVAGPLPGVAGRLLFAKYNELWSLELGTAKLEKMVAFQEQSFVGWPAVSPDGKLVAFSLYRPGRTPQELGGSDLFVMSATGSDRRMVLAHDTPGSSLSEPAWAAGSAGLYFTRRGLDGSARIERIGLDGAGRTPLVPNAQSPAVAPDGSRMLYLTTNPKTSSQLLWTAGVDGTGAKTLVTDQDFTLLGFPRFAPDSKRVAFVAVGGPTPPAKPASLPSGRALPGGLLELPPAYAHGVPWDLWVINTDGTGLKRLTEMGGDSPVPAWSPDGQRIALAMEFGIYLVDLIGSPPLLVAEDFTTGGVTWLPR